MGRVNASFAVDLLQLLNIALQERRKAVKEALGDEGFFIHSPKLDQFEVRSLRGPVAVFSLSPLPGCCGVVVSYYAATEPALQKKGIGSLLAEVRMDAARRKGYGQMLATVLSNNKTEQDILSKLGWVQVGEFRNPQTGSLVQTWRANL